jgi:Skp family chaperone for outer membrane proteins
MKHSTKSSGRLVQPLILAASLLGVGVLAYKSGAQAGAPAPLPTVVATVNVEQVVNDCAETNARNKANDAKYKGDIDSLKAMEANLTSLANEYKNTPPENRAARRDLLLKRTELEGKYKAKSDFLQSAFDEEKADVIRDVYNKALKSIEQHATQNAIALVVVDDTVLSVPNEGGMNSVTSAVIRRRVLFSNKSQLDITAQILAKMNNDFSATGGKAPAPAKNEKKK